MSALIRQALSNAINFALRAISTPKKVHLSRGTFFERRVNINGEKVSYLYRTLTPVERELHYAKIFARHKSQQKEASLLVEEQTPTRL